MKCHSLLLLVTLIGFTVGDELGFKESLTNVENSRRRSSQGSKLDAAIAQAQQANIGKPIVPRTASNNQTKSPPAKQLNLAAFMPTKVPVHIPSFKPIPPGRPSFSASNSTRRMGTEVASNGEAPSNSVSKLNEPSKVSLTSPQGSKTQGASKLSSTNLATRTLPFSTTNDIISPSKNISPVRGMTNISAEALEAAILLREHELLKQKAASAHRSSPVRQISSTNKVMNAPKEYYPVGYDKNFDDNFASRVDLPDTSFYCGDQKHFPGLYADEDLGCMVFHVCALTDDGLIMKSFLCPESTLFDQTILKCNWWFYVDCKNSKKLYDSNIPISKSYQLMKALTFFSSYKKGGTSTKSKKKD